MDMDNLLLAYLSPETLLPMTSVLAGGLGVILMFGRNIFRLITTVARKLLPTRIYSPIVTKPHVRIDGLARKTSLRD